MRNNHLSISKKWGKAALILSFTTLLGACSSTQSWWNAVDWRDRDENKPQTTASAPAAQNPAPIAQPMPPAPPVNMAAPNMGYSDLSSVPLQPPGNMPAYQRDVAQQQLQQDRFRAQNMMNQNWGAPSAQQQQYYSDNWAQSQANGRQPLWDGRPTDLTRSRDAAGLPWQDQQQMGQPMMSPPMMQQQQMPMMQQPMMSQSSQAMMAPPMMPPRQQDRIAPSMNTYTQSMQQSAPYTSGQPYAPYGGGNQWYYPSQQWATAPAVAPMPQLPTGNAAVTPSSTQPVATIYFENNSAKMGSDDTKVLQQVAEWAKSQPGFLRVEGHASARTRDVTSQKQALKNYKISLDRAEQVAKQLESYGVARDRIVVKALADKEPAYRETVPAGEAWNRRVEVFAQPAVTPNTRMY